MKRFQTVKIAALAALLLTACEPKVQTHGYMQETEFKDKLVVGVTTRDQVMAELGSPSAYSSFGDDVWYYVSSRQETYAFMQTEVTDQKVVRIEFDAAGLVKKVDTFDQKDSQKFDIVKRETPTEGHSMTVVEQLLGNIGRFNAPSRNQSIAPGRPGH